MRAALLDTWLWRLCWCCCWALSFWFHQHWWTRWLALPQTWQMTFHLPFLALWPFWSLWLCQTYFDSDSMTKFHWSFFLTWSCLYFLTAPESEFDVLMIRLTMTFRSPGVAWKSRWIFVSIYPWVTWCLSRHIQLLCWDPALFEANFRFEFLLCLIPFWVDRRFLPDVFHELGDQGKSNIYQIVVTISCRLRPLFPKGEMALFQYQYRKLPPCIWAKTGRFGNFSGRFWQISMLHFLAFGYTLLKCFVFYSVEHRNRAKNYQTDPFLPA